MKITIAALFDKVTEYQTTATTQSDKQKEELHIISTINNHYVLHSNQLQQKVEYD
jgi:hypothetical protein